MNCDHFHWSVAVNSAHILLVKHSPRQKPATRRVFSVYFAPSSCSLSLPNHFEVFCPGRTGLTRTMQGHEKPAWMKGLWSLQCSLLLPDRDTVTLRGWWIGQWLCSHVLGRGSLQTPVFISCWRKWECMDRWRPEAWDSVKNNKVRTTTLVPLKASEFQTAATWNCPSECQFCSVR